ncbi:MAG: dephospho-CoA kinase [Roseburia sp.]|nr:dephospho-CoA kinase [Roseburia sp.]
MKQNNIKIAVTGGIGSGKTTVCNIIEKLGYPVFSCDKVYGELLNGGSLNKMLSDEFGSEILTEGNIDRSKLSACVFGDKIKLRKLNEITHPAIFSEMFLRSEKFKGLVFFEVPLLFEGNYQNLFNDVLVVLREERQRIDSVKLRDNLSDRQVYDRIENQCNYDMNNFAQYYVIHNSGKIDDLSGIIGEILLKLT